MTSVAIDSLEAMLADRRQWPEVHFGETARSIADRVEDPAAAGVDRYVGLEHLDPGTLRIRRWGQPTDVQATKLRFRPGDVVFGRRRAYQRKVGLAEFEGICSAHALVLRAQPDRMHPEFLPYFLQSDVFFDLAEAISVGSLSPTINWRTLAKQRFVVPPLHLQQRAAVVLAALDRSIWAYEDAADAAGRTAIVAAGEAPEVAGAPTVTLGECLQGVFAGKSSSGTNRPAMRSEVGVLKVSAVGDGQFVPAENKALLDPQNFLPEAAVRQGDVLFSRANTSELVGRVCIVDADYPNLMLSDKTLRLVIDEDRAVKEYIVLALRLPSARRQMRTVATGTGGAMKNISQKKLRDLLISLPPRAGQATVVQRHVELIRLADTLRDQAECVRRMKAGLLSRLARSPESS